MRTEHYLPSTSLELDESLTTKDDILQHTYSVTSSSLSMRARDGSKFLVSHSQSSLISVELKA